MDGELGTSNHDSISSFLTNSRRDDTTFWNELCPHLTISDSDLAKIGRKGIPHDAIGAKRKREKLISHGYSLVDESFDPELVCCLREGIKVLHKHHLPATFILLFDETWELARASRATMQQSAHPTNQFNYDLLAWYIEPGMAGFSVSE
eukprot:scaffold23625_cov137-Cylindrotheca_fusiformis.AAC.12